jgi:prepilin-type N-terminal cleavage/methylation domain-containing protein
MDRDIPESAATNTWRGSRRAMTLVELLMVMVVMAILLSIAVPAINSIGRGSNLRGAVSDVRNTIAQARQWAITHRGKVSFCYVTASTSAYYYVMDAFPPNEYILSNISLPRGIRFDNNGSVSSVTFKTDGSVDGGVPPPYTTISLAGSNGTRHIHVNRLTGGISVSSE